MSHDGYPRSGLLIALNDVFVSQLLADPLYRVDRDGSVWTKQPRAGKRLLDEWRRKATQLNDDGYVVLHYRRKKLMMHRVMHAAFNGPLSKDLIVNHKDGRRDNNSPDNLELITQSDNNTHRFQVLNRCAVAGHRKIHKDAADLMRVMYWERGFTFRQVCEFARENYGLRSKGSVSMLLNYKTWNKDLTLAPTVTAA